MVDVSDDAKVADVLHYGAKVSKDALEAKPNKRGIIAEIINTSRAS